MSTPEWLAAEWSTPPNVRALTTTRHTGRAHGVLERLRLLHRPGSDVTDDAETATLLARILGLPSQPVWLRQVHGAHVARGHALVSGVEADAAYTDRPGAVLAVLTADCLPVVIADARGREVAVAHAGWCGLAAGVLEATVAAFTAEPGELIAHIGPGIGADAYEIGPEVREALLHQAPNAADCFHTSPRGSWHVDLAAVALRRLRAIGLDTVTRSGQCTWTDAERFYSYRRDGRTGRLATLVWTEHEPSAPMPTGGPPPTSLRQD